MRSYFVIILCLNVIHCEDWCSLIAPNGQFNGFQVYHSYVKNKNIMYRNGIQWQWKLDLDSFGIKMIDNSNQTYDKNIVNRFSSYDSKSGYDCTIEYKTDSKQQIQTKCSNRFDDSLSQYDAKALIFRTPAEKTNKWLLIFNQKNASIWCYNTQDVSQNRLINVYSQCYSLVKIPLFVIQIADKNMAKKLIGIVEWIVKDIEGYILFFNIKNRPKFCYQNSEKDLTCNSDEALTPLFSQCFHANEEESSNTTLIVIGIVIVVIALILVIGIVIYCYREAIIQHYQDWKRNRDIVSTFLTDTEKTQQTNTSTQITQPSTSETSQTTTKTDPNTRVKVTDQ